MTREYPDRPIVGVGVVVLSAQGVLLIRRGKPPRKGKWSLPGGAQKLGETVFDAGRREVLEETGLLVDVLGLIDVVDSIRPDDEDDDGGGKIRFHYTLVDILAVVAGANAPAGDPIAGGDAVEAAWIPLADIPGLELWSETERIIGLGEEMHAALIPRIG